MKRCEYQIGPTGQISHAAPSGYHDDCVMALALGVWGCHTFGVEPGRMLRLGVGGPRSEIRGRREITLARTSSVSNARSEDVLVSPAFKCLGPLLLRTPRNQSTFERERQRGRIATNGLR